MRRKFGKTRYPGIYEGAFAGKKPDRWKVVYRVKGLGQRSCTFRSKAEAVAFQGQVRDPGRWRELRALERGKIPLSAHLASYMDSKRGWRPSTRERNKYAAKVILDGPLGQLRLRDITRETVEAWVSDMVASGVKPGSYEKAVVLLGAALEAGVRDGFILRNPVRGVELPSRATREPFPLSPEQVARVAERVPERYRAVVYLMALLGPRIGEVSAIQVCDVDLEEGVLHIRRNSPEIGGHTRLGVGGSLARSLRTTNPIESMISIARTTARNVKRWRSGAMALRWTAAGMLQAERQFRKLNGFKDLQMLKQALRHHEEVVKGGKLVA